MIKSYTFKNKTYFLIQLSFTDDLGKRHQPKIRRNPKGERISSEKQARLLEMEFLLRLKSESNEINLKITFAQWHALFLKNIKLVFRNSTVMKYDGDLKKWLDHDFNTKEMGLITKQDVHDFVYQRMSVRNATPNTQRRVLRSLQRVFQAALEDGIITKNPTTGIIVKVPPAKKCVLNSKEVEHFLVQAKIANHPFYFPWTFALFTGMRSGELYGLRWTDIDEVSGNITISNQWTSKDGYHSTKSNKNRVFPISKNLHALIREVRTLGPFAEELRGLNGTSHFFGNLVLPRIPEWKYGQQGLVTRDFCKMIGITPVQFHDLRATFITNLLAQGTSLPKVMSIVGHSKMSTTDEYLRLAGVNVKGATDNLGYDLPCDSYENVITLRS